MSLKNLLSATKKNKSESTLNKVDDLFEVDKNFEKTKKVL
jgi:hypothetical protein